MAVEIPQLHCTFVSKTSVHKSRHEALHAAAPIHCFIPVHSNNNTALKSPLWPEQRALILIVKCTSVCVRARARVYARRSSPKITKARPYDLPGLRVHDTRSPGA